MDSKTINENFIDFSAAFEIDVDPEARANAKACFFAGAIALCGELTRAVNAKDWKVLAARLNEYQKELEGFIALLKLIEDSEDQSLLPLLQFGMH